MADNVGYTPGVGATVAADEIAGVLHQRVKIGVGADGVAVDVSATNPMPVTGTVSTGLSQPLTDTQLRATPVPVSGTVSTGLSQPLTDSQLRAAPVPITGSVSANTGLSQPLTDTQLRATAVSVVGPLTDTQLRASPVSVSVGSIALPSGASTSALQVTGNTSLSNIDGKIPSLVSGRIPVDGSGVTQPVSVAGSIAVTGPLTDTQLRASPVPVSGTVTANTGLAQPLTDAQLRATAVPVSVGSIALPTGASTLAEQQSQTALLGTIDADTGNIASSASSIDTKTPALVSGRVPVDGSGVTQPVSIAASVAVTGPLTDTQLRATPVPISGTVTANTGLTQPLTDAQLRATAVPVSASSLPLPSGAATSAKQPALGTAGTASSDVITVQGIASMTALKVDGSAVTQPVSIASSVAVTGPLTDTQLRATPVPISGTVTANTGLTQPLTDSQLRATAVPVSGPLTDTQLRATAVPVSAASLPLPTGAATETTLSSLNTKIPSSLTTSASRLLVDGSGVTQPISAASLPLPSGAATEATLATLLDTADFQARIPVNGQAAMAASLPVVIASDQTDIKTKWGDSTVTTFSQTGAISSGTILVSLDLLNYAGVSLHCVALGSSGGVVPEWSINGTNWVSGTLISPNGLSVTSMGTTGLYYVPRVARYFRLRLASGTTSGTTTFVVESYVAMPSFWVAALGAGTNAIGDVGVQYRANATGAASGAHLVSGATTNATVAKASAGRLIGWNFANTNAAWRYVKLHNQATTPTAGSGVVRTIGIPPNNISQIHFEGGIAFSTGIAFTTVTGAADADTTAVGANDIVGDLYYA